MADDLEVILVGVSGDSARMLFFIDWDILYKSSICNVVISSFLEREEKKSYGENDISWDK